MGRPAMTKFGSIRNRKHDPSAIDPADRQFKKLKGRWIDPMDVLENAQRWTLCRERNDHIQNLIDGPILYLLRRKRGQLSLIFDGYRQQPREQRSRSVRIVHQTRKIGLQLSELVDVGIGAGHLRRQFHLLNDREERALAVIGRTLI